VHLVGYLKRNVFLILEQNKNMKLVRLNISGGYGESIKKQGVIRQKRKEFSERATGVIA
jgi:hypothetical protein